ncbi:MAG: hypothetical protein HFACDABA_02487 [Anaerolineales bacterium]|nr:hypothetical protein [Anaerolineales bacterium]
MTLSKFLKLLSWSVIIAAIIVCVLIYAPIPQHWSFESRAELERIRTELPLAEAKWKSHNVTDYDIEVSAMAHPLMCADFDNNFAPWHLKIRQGQTVFENEIQKNSVNDCNIELFLPPTVFDTIKEILETADADYTYLKIEFDPEYGFMTTYSLTANNRISDLNVYYSFTNFRPKKP